MPVEGERIMYRLTYYNERGDIESIYNNRVKNRNMNEYFGTESYAKKVAEKFAIELDKRDMSEMPTGGGQEWNEVVLQKSFLVGDEEDDTHVIANYTTKNGWNYY